jgi:hypothetical protein
MANFLNGSSIRLIRTKGGLVAGQPKHYELWLYGGVVTITDPAEVSWISKVIAEASSIDAEATDYLEYIISAGQD